MAVAHNGDGARAVAARTGGAFVGMLIMPIYEPVIVALCVVFTAQALMLGVLQHALSW